MKPSEIKVGRTYRDTAGNLRRVVDEGLHLIPYGSVPDEIAADPVRYMAVRRAKFGKTPVGRLSVVTRRQMARWAKAVVEEEAE